MKKGYYDLNEKNPGRRGENILQQDDYFAQITGLNKKDKKSTKNIFREGLQESNRQSKVEMSSKRFKIIDQNVEIVNNHKQGSVSKTFACNQRNNIDADEKYRQKKVIACSIVKKGYGFNLFQEYLEDQKSSVIFITRQKYKSYSLSIIQQGYRKLQWFLRTQCEKVITALRHEEMRLVVKYLIKINSYFSAKEAKTFNKLISIVYSLRTVTISQSQAIELYKSAMQILKAQVIGSAIKPIAEIKNIQQQQLTIDNKNIWTKKLEQDLINLYELNQNMAKVFKCFITVHSQFSNLFTQKALKQKLDSIFFRILKSISYFHMHNRSRLPALTSLSESRLKFLVLSPICKDIRIILLQFYDQGELQKINMLSPLILMINERLSDKKDLKYRGNEYNLSESKVTEYKQPMIGSFTQQRDKHEQIFKISRFAARIREPQKLKQIKINYYDEPNQLYSD